MAFVVRSFVLELPGRAMKTVGLAIPRLVRASPAILAIVSAFSMELPLRTAGAAGGALDRDLARSALGAFRIVEERAVLTSRTVKTELQQTVLAFQARGSGRCGG
jgi:hypothetical protein